MTRLFVGNLASAVTQADLRAVFALYGPVGSAEIATDTSSGGAGGFVEMAWQAHAMAALQALDGTALKGQIINVSRAGPSRERGGREIPPRGWEVVGDSRRRS